MVSRQTALIRGINVGRAKRVAMADLRALMEELGYSDVKNILNSGNVVFTSQETNTINSARRIEETLYAKTGISAKVMVFTEGEIADIVEDNPLSDIATDPSRLLVMFLQNPTDLILLKPLVQQEWTPDVLDIGCRAAYLWCGNGILASKLTEAAGRVLGEAATTRNWATVMKIYALMKNQSS